MILVRIHGGLGNQMFQYAFSYRLAKDRGVICKLDISGFANDPRPYALDHLKIEAGIMSPAEIKKLQPKFRVWRARCEKFLPWLSPFLPSPMPFIRQKTFSFNAEILNSPAPCYLDGYWQTEKYFLPVAEDIRRQFQLVEPMTAERQQTAALIQQANAVSVHVRRGDYVSNATAATFHGTCAPEWYHRAMSLMAKKVGNPHFFIFSDDPDWARANLPTQWPAHFVDPQSDKRDCEDMHLMALCRHNIIANSSFSWWGAWLNADPDKQVIAPQQWFAQGHEDTQDITPPAWVRL